MLQMIPHNKFKFFIEYATQTRELCGRKYHYRWWFQLQLSSLDKREIAVNNQVPKKRLGTSKSHFSQNLPICPPLKM